MLSSGPSHDILQPPALLHKYVAMCAVLIRKILLDHFELLGINDETTNFKVKCVLKMIKL